MSESESVAAVVRANPPALGDPVAPLAQVVHCDNGLVFLSGQLALSPAGGLLHPGSPGEQAGVCLDRIEAALHSLGCDLSNVLSATIFLARAEDFPELNRVWEARFRGAYPARTTVIADLLVPGALVEVQAVAARPGSPE